jgi:hypothetical protein
MMPLDYRVARDDLADCESPGHIGIILTQRSFEKQSKRLMPAGVHARTRELCHGFPQSSLGPTMPVEKVTVLKRGRLKHLLISNRRPVKEPLWTGAAKEQSITLDL